MFINTTYVKLYENPVNKNALFFIYTYMSIVNA